MGQSTQRSMFPKMSSPPRRTPVLQVSKWWSGKNYRFGVYHKHLELWLQLNKININSIVLLFQVESENNIKIQIYYSLRNQEYLRLFISHFYFITVIEEYDM